MARSYNLSDRQATVMRWHKTFDGWVAQDRQGRRWRARGPLQMAAARPMWWLYCDTSRVCLTPGLYDTAAQFPTAAAAIQYAEAHS